jgi:hypothetical protein
MSAEPSTVHGAWLRHRGDLLLAVLVLVAYWPLVLGWSTIPAGDTQDCWLPWRWLIASILHDSGVPQWNLWQQMGYPLHADLQGPAWYLEAIVLGGTVGMGPAVQQFLFLAYVIIGGWGMRRWVELFVRNGNGALLAAITYALSGFITGHAMHQFAIISAAWLPWCLWALQRLLSAPGWRAAVRLALFASLQLTGGNHGLLIITSYPALALVLVTFWRDRHDHALALQRLRWSAVAVLVTVLLAAGTFHAAVEASHHVDRLHGMGLEQAQVNPVTLSALPSALLPFVATGGADELGTDPTMANVYVGAIALLLVLAGVCRLRRTPVLQAVVLPAVPAFLAALGSATPVHGWMWSALPGIDLFRFPAYFLYPVILALMPLVALGYDVLEGRMQRCSVGAALLLLSCLALWHVLPADASGSFMDLLLSGTPDTIAPDGRSVLLLGIALWTLAGIALLLADRRWLLPMLALEGVVAVHATRWHTAMAPLTPAELVARIQGYPSGPLPPTLTPMAANRDGRGPVAPLWRNTRVFQGGPGHDGFNSFWLSQHQRLAADHPNLFATMCARPVVSLSGDVRPASSITDDRIDPLRDAGIVLLEDDEPLVQGRSGGALSMLDGDHQRMVLRSSSEHPAFMLVQQNLYPGWRIRVDGVPVKPVRANVAAFGAWLPAGEHTVEVSYERPLLSMLLQLQHMAWFTGLFLVLWQGKWRTITMPLAAVGSLGWLVSMYGHRTKAEELAIGWDRLRSWGAAWKEAVWAVNSDRPLPDDDRRIRTYRIDAPDRAEALAAVLQDLPDTVVVAWYGCMPTESQRAWLSSHAYTPFDSLVAARYGAWSLVRIAQAPPQEVLHRDASPVILSPGSPYGRACRVPSDSLRRQGDALVVRATCKGDLGGSARVVVEQRVDGAAASYEAIPLEGPAGPDGWAEAVVVRRTDGLMRGTEWGAYLWYDGADSLNVKEFVVELQKIAR